MIQLFKLYGCKKLLAKFSSDILRIERVVLLNIHLKRLEIQVIPSVKLKVRLKGALPNVHAGFLGIDFFFMLLLNDLAYFVLLRKYL